MATVEDVARVNYLAILPTGQAVSNSFHVHSPGLGEPDIGFLADLAGDVDAYFTTTYRAMFTATATVKAVRTFSVPVAGTKDPYLEYVFNINLVGTNGNTQTGPDSLCAVAAVQTPVAKRFARGHIFLPPQTLATMDNNGKLWNQSAGSWASWAAFVAKLATGCAPSPTWTGSALSASRLAIYSKVQDKVVGDLVTEATAVTLRPEVRWLRSRERGSS
jgi:hypothetical protein